jgi:peptidoglycan hydrolase-like protein with peptidoglycan-binding domain
MTTRPRSTHATAAQSAGPPGKAAASLLAGLLALGVCVTLAPGAAADTTAAAQAGPTTPVAFSATLLAANLPAWPVLRQGSNNQWPPATVRSLQYLLNAHGARLEPDGIFGARTDAAVRAFQQAHGLTVDGIVGPQTWSAVIITVHRGSTGPAVKAVQDQANFRDLRGEGPPTLQVDGIFGAKTDSWVRSFQSGVALVLDAPGFQVDGIVGPMTWQAMIAETLAG